MGKDFRYRFSARKSWSLLRWLLMKALLPLSILAEFLHREQFSAYWMVNNASKYNTLSVLTDSRAGWTLLRDFMFKSIKICLEAPMPWKRQWQREVDIFCSYTVQMTLTNQFDIPMLFSSIIPGFSRNGTKSRFRILAPWSLTMLLSVLLWARLFCTDDLHYWSFTTYMFNMSCVDDSVIDIYSQIPKKSCDLIHAVCFSVKYFPTADSLGFDVQRKVYLLEVLLNDQFSTSTSSTYPMSVTSFSFSRPL